MQIGFLFNDYIAVQFSFPLLHPDKSPARTKQNQNPEDLNPLEANLSLNLEPEALKPINAGQYAAQVAAAAAAGQEPHSNMSPTTGKIS